MCDPSAKGITTSFRNVLGDLNLPDLSSMVSDPPKKATLKRFGKKYLAIISNLSFLSECERLPLSECELRLHRPAAHWSVSVGDPLLTRQNNFRIRLLVGCDGLEHDAARFRTRRNPHLVGACCKLCGQGVAEDASHFIAHCSALDEARLCLISEADVSVQRLIPDPSSDPDGFVTAILGTNWIHNTDFQHFVSVSYQI